MSQASSASNGYDVAFDSPHPKRTPMTAPTDSVPPAATPSRGPLGALLDLFSSVWLGVWLLSILFVYSWVGSAGVPYYMGGNPADVGNWLFEQIRQRPGLEMTEYEWFNWWPFNLLITLICVNLTVTTIRRIKPNTINLGVWLIHTGIVVLCLGSYLYFSNKVEGDAPVARRQLVIEVPGGETLTMPAVPGNRESAMTAEGPYQFFVQDCDPEWTLLSGPDEGSKAFAVQVMVDAPSGRFMRMLIANQPDATQDSVFVSDGEGPPMQRAIKALGRPLVDESLGMRLEYLPQPWFYLANWVEKSWALYLREAGSYEWTMRPIEGLPLYNDYVGFPEEVWVTPGEPLQTGGLSIDVAASEPGDPLEDVPLKVVSYLRYARDETRWVDGGALNPTLTLRLEDGMGEAFDYELVAFDPARNSASRGFATLRWVDDVADRERMGTPAPAMMHVSIPGTDIHLEHLIERYSLRDPEAPWTDVGDSGYAFRVQFVTPMDDPDLPDVVAMVELRQGERRWRRLVSEDPTFVRDVDAGDDGLAPSETYAQIDEGISIDFHAPIAPASVTLVAGPGDDDLGLVLNMGSPMDGSYQSLAVGEAFSIGRGNMLTVRRFGARSEEQKRPSIVPRSRRDRDAKEAFSQVRVAITSGGQTEHLWVPFHQYPIRDPKESLRRYWYAPAQITLNGKDYEFILSRERMALPDPVVLDDFVIQSHEGGFTGRTSSILNWTSKVRFGEGDAMTDPALVSVNGPQEHRGMWFFQAQWDPPSGPRGRGDVASKGLNYTVLGVGNREGVGIQLLGCCIAVLGMMYAFYVKPILIKRQRSGARRNA